MPKTILSGEIQSKTENVMQQPQQYGYSAMAITPPQPARKLMTQVQIQLDSYTTIGTEPGDKSASGGKIEGSVSLNFDNVEALSFLRAGTRVNLTLEDASPLAQLANALKNPAIATKVPDAETPIFRPDMQWRGDDGKAQTAADQAQREGLPF